MRGGLHNNHMTQLTHEGTTTDRPPLVDGTAAAATFLIVEDEIVVSFFIRTLLEERGLQVAVASTAAEALQLPIVIATGFSETEYGRRFQDDARIRVIGKPFDAPQLWSVLGTLDDQFA